MSKRCLKCQHVAEIEYSAIAACPACGAVYSKVESLAQAAAPQAEPEAVAAAAAPLKRPIDVPPTPAARPSPSKFIDELRAESIYPTFRGFVQVFYVIGLVLAGAIFIGGLVTTFFGGRNPMAFFGGLFMAVLFVLIARLFKETWLMIADLSDATVRVARGAPVSPRE